MPGTTPVYGFPYERNADVPGLSTRVEAGGTLLAEAVETVLQALFGADPFTVANDLQVPGDLIVAGTVETSSSVMRPAEHFQTANDTSASTSYVPGTLNGLAFTAPPSGIVKVTIQGLLGSNAVSISTTAPISRMSTYVRNGVTIGSGTDFLTPNDDRAFGYWNRSATAAFKYVSGHLSHLVTGLTAGSGYNVTSVFKAEVGGATVAVNDRRLLVEPVF